MKNPMNVITLIIFSVLFGSCNDYCIEGRGPAETRELSLSPITGFTYAGSGNVYVQKGQEQKVIIEGQPNILDRIDTRVSAGYWNIEYDGCIRRADEINVYITVPELEYIGLVGSGRITGISESENFDELEVVLSGSGMIDLDVYTASVKSRLTGSGTIRIHGEAVRENVHITGSGNYRGYGMEVRSAEVTISGSGDAHVFVQDALEVNIEGSGNVYYHGDPEVHARITGSGKVVRD